MKMIHIFFVHFVNLFNVRQERLLKFFDIINADGPQSRNGKLAYKYYLKWKRDHLPQCFVILGNEIREDFSNMCQSKKHSALSSCHQVKHYFTNNCDDEF